MPAGGHDATGTSRRRLVAVVLGALGALALAVVPTVAGARSAAAPGTASLGEGLTAAQSTTTTLVTTSTNVLVTSPPPTVAPPTTVAAAAVGREWPVVIPVGCDEPALPDIVFVGTVQAADQQTARYRIDQLRAGDASQFSYQGLIDIRHGIDTKYLQVGSQYLVGARLDPAAGVLVSRVTAPEPLFGGDDVIGESETDADCPVLADPVRTLLTNGLPVDSGVLKPMEEARTDVLGALLVPVAAALAIVLGLVAIRWGLTGLGWTVGALFRAGREPREARAVRRTGLGQPR